MPMSGPHLLWLGFALLIGAMMWLDLGVINRHAHVITFRNAALWCAIWFFLAMLFNGAVLYVEGREKGLQFLAGYLLELSLSVDNMFIFILIFKYFAIAPLYQSRVLHWGILGAQVMRMIFIMAGVSLIRSFHWMVYVFGFMVLYTGAKMLLQKEDESPDLASNPAIKLLKRFLPLTTEHRGEKFFTRENGNLHATPLLAALLVIEASDVIFALDSIPAVIAITPDPFIVYTSNIFAILGLRSLFFMLSGLLGLFRYLKVGISVILCFVGIKMLMESFYKIPIGVSLGVIAGILALSISASVLIKRKHP